MRKQELKDWSSYYIMGAVQIFIITLIFFFEPISSLLTSASAIMLAWIMLGNMWLEVKRLRVTYEYETWGKKGE